MSTQKTEADEASVRANHPLIVVIPDGHTPKESQRFGWKDAAFMAAGLVPGVQLVSTIGHVGYRVYKAWDGAGSDGIKVATVTQSEAARYTFPPGHPRENVLYVRHPVLPSVYSTTASFHRMAFEHKFAEAIHMLVGLGANEIKIEHNRGWSREFAAGFSSPLHTGKTKMKIGGSENKSETLLFEATLQGSRTPTLPDDLVWYPHEPLWQMVGRARLSDGLQKFSLQLDYVDDFGVNANLGAAAAKAGYELGGTFEGHRATTWEIRGTFL